MEEAFRAEIQQQRFCGGQRSTALSRLVLRFGYIRALRRRMVE